jgi:hypothetical protein
MVEEEREGEGERGREREAYVIINRKFVGI